jgi:hypothetical protein
MMGMKKGSAFLRRPVSKLGWWAVALAIAYLVMNIINTVVMMRQPELSSWLRSLTIAFGILMILSGLASGIVATIAILRKRDRSWMVWLALAPGLAMLFLLFGELIFPH